MTKTMAAATPDIALAAGGGRCGICAGPLRTGLAPWHRECAACGYESASLRPAINTHDTETAIDEASREIGLKALRQHNFRLLLDRICERLAEGGRTPREARLLDVGAAHGWFVRTARERLQAIGLEPDDHVRAMARAAGVELVGGYFPQALDTGERFDVITFNDVFEHLPDPHAALDACRAHLDPGGLLVLNLPCSDGAIYRAAKLLHRLGLRGPFERMWQKGLVSPHLHYFNKDNLARLLAVHGFGEPRFSTLPAVRLRGLYHRMRHSASIGVPRALAACIVVGAAVPFLRFFPSDILVVTARRS
ncbi:MAG: class I SAM-dependent methyltransferase [Ramlibacter sp.]